MTLVLDASVTLGWIFQDERLPYAELVLNLLQNGERAVAPRIWMTEVANALVTAERRGRIDASDTSAFLGRVTSLSIEVDLSAAEVDWGTTLTIARAHRLSVYDACYVELAGRLGAPLATLDRAMEDAARAMRIAILER